jgi:hypothetical protein
MKKKLLFSAAIVPALVATGAMGQVVNFQDGNNGFLSVTFSYAELFAGQGAYSDPNNNIWNGFGAYIYNDGGYGSASVYNPGNANWPPLPGNPGNPYAAYLNSSSNMWFSSTGPSLYTFTGSATNCGNSTSGGQWTPITLSVLSYEGPDLYDNTLLNAYPNAAPFFLLSTSANKKASEKSDQEVFVLGNVPPGTYGLYLYGANPIANEGTAFAVNSGNAHNGISATVNAEAGSPNQTFVEGQNFVIFENVTPDGSGNITITASPNNSAEQVDVNGFQLIFNPPPTAVAMTAAQNVFAGATASFSFSPAFAASPSFQWQSVIGGVTNNLTDGGGISGSKTTNLTISAVSSANVGLYQCVISTSTATNTNLAAPLTVLTSTATSHLLPGDTIGTVGYILSKLDALSDFNNNFIAPYDSVPPAFNMPVNNVDDDTLFQYDNFGANSSAAPFQGAVGIVATPYIGSTLVTGMRLFASSSYREDDPADFLLEGSNDGTNFTAITGGLLSIPAQRNAAAGAINITNQALQEIDFPNSAHYLTYRLTFTNVLDNDIASNGVQLAEIQLLGSLAPVAPSIHQQSLTNEIILAGQTFQPAVVVVGAGPLSYQWYFNSSLLSGQTNAALAVSNITAANNGSYYCQVSNPFGSINATAINLTVVTPSPYQQTLLSFNPLGYWPLNETSGTTAYDLANGYNGTYIGNDYNLGQPGATFPGFGSPNLCTLLNPDDLQNSYIDIPEGPFNINGPVTVITWFQSSYNAAPYEDLISHGFSSYYLVLDSSAFAHFNDNENANNDAQGMTPLDDGNWHMIVGVYEGGNGNTSDGFVYVDGLLVGNTTISSNSLARNSFDLVIGNGPDYFFLYGGQYATYYAVESANLAHCAVIPQALSEAQIQQLYYAADVAPIISPQPPATVPIGLGGTGSIAAEGFGTPPLSYQWLLDTTPVSGPEYSGETTTNLTITDASLGDGGSYYLVVSNNYGSVTSLAAVVTIYETPQILTSLPATNYVLLGYTLTLPYVDSGAVPLTNAWYANGSLLANGGRISGATTTSLTISNAQYSDAGNYTYTASNSFGGTSENTAVVVEAGLFGDFSDWSIQDNNVSSSGQGIILGNNEIQMTDNHGGEETAFFLTNQVYVGAFIASYVYQNLTPNGGDGFTFIVQNTPAGAQTLGTQVNGGSGVGYSPISPSVGLCTEIYSVHNGPGIALQTNGASPGFLNGNNYTQPAPIIVGSGDPIRYNIFYDGNNYNVTLMDLTSNLIFSTSFPLGPIANYVGSNIAYVGFGAGTGGAAAVQVLSDFTYTPLMLTAARSGSNLVISWPTAFGTNYQLQETSNLSIPASWSAIAGPYNVVSNLFQSTIPSPTGSEFYRLAPSP